MKEDVFLYIKMSFKASYYDYENSLTTEFILSGLFVGYYIQNQNSPVTTLLLSAAVCGLLVYT